MDYENPGRAYSLAFIPKRRARRREAPELVLRIETRDLPYIESFIQKTDASLARAARQYLGEDLSFCWPGMGQLPLPLLKQSDAIGYRNCGYLKRGEEVEVRLPLRERHAAETVLTLTILLEAVNGIPGEERKSNRPQLMSISSDCRRSGQYAHPLYGHVYPPMRRWLNTLGTEGFPASVVDAMRETWRAVAPQEIRKYADGCQAVVTEDGRFGLVCFGNACDVSIYPDYLWRDEPDVSCEFGCHNLDTAFQQLTLIAGLAQMMSIIESRD